MVQDGKTETSGPFTNIMDLTEVEVFLIHTSDEKFTGLVFIRANEVQHDTLFNRIM